MFGFARSPECEVFLHEWGGLETKPEKRAPDATLRVFSTPWVERYLSKAHPASPGFLFIPLIVGGIAYSASAGMSALTIAGWYGLGVLLWTLEEYLFHRYYFHLSDFGTFQGKMRSFMVHGYHHEFPNDKMRLVAPPMMSMSIGFILASLYYFAFGFEVAIPVFAGTSTGYLAYDWIHYYTHHAQPRTWLGKYLRRYHMEHHFKDHDTHFGISSPLWDYIFRTVSSKNRPAP